MQQLQHAQGRLAHREISYSELVKFGPLFRKLCQLKKSTILVCVIFTRFYVIITFCENNLKKTAAFDEVVYF